MACSSEMKMVVLFLLLNAVLVHASWKMRNLSNNVPDKPWQPPPENSHGRIFVTIIIILILVFMALVIVRCILDYRKDRQKNGFLRTRSNSSHPQPETVLKGKNFKEELEQAVKDRAERMERQEQQQQQQQGPSGGNGEVGQDEAPAPLLQIGPEDVMLV